MSSVCHDHSLMDVAEREAKAKAIVDDGEPGQPKTNLRSSAAALLPLSCGAGDSGTFLEDHHRLRIVIDVARFGPQREQAHSELLVEAARTKLRGAATSHLLRDAVALPA